MLVAKKSSKDNHRRPRTEPKRILYGRAIKIKRWKKKETKKKSKEKKTKIPPEARCGKKQQGKK
jgi:hypothetical protein